MSPVFIKIMKDETRCPNCKASKKDGYSVCAKHLEYAKQHWRTWSTKRRSLSKCCYCSKDSVNGWLRCIEHTVINKKKCKSWYYVNKAKFASTDKCPVCRGKRKKDRGKKQCEKCRLWHYLYHRGIHLPWSTSREFLRERVRKIKMSLPVKRKAYHL